jgi:hypothetical protein
MALFVVERDVSNTSPEQLRLDQRRVASACMLIKAQGRRIRYVSSAVVPADGSARDLFGADDAEVVKEVHATAGVQFSRIVEVFDLTPSFLPQGISRSRRSLQGGVGYGSRAVNEKGMPHTMTAHSSPELARWLTDGQRLFQVCLETLQEFERTQARNQTLETENEMLREEVARLRQKSDSLQADRSEMIAAFNDLAGHVTQVVDHILQKSEEGNGGER